MTMQQAPNSDTKGSGIRDEIGDAADTAREHTANVANEAATQARNVVGEARRNLQHEADAQTRRAASSLTEIGGDLRSMADSAQHPDGVAAELARRTAETIERTGRRAEDGGIDAIVGDVQAFARRNPAVFLLAAGAAGFLAGRVLRNADLSEAASSATGSDQGSQTGQPGNGSSFADDQLPTGEGGTPPAPYGLSTGYRS